MRIPAGTSPWVQASANLWDRATSGREPLPPLGGNIRHHQLREPPSQGGNLDTSAGTTAYGWEPATEREPSSAAKLSSGTAFPFPHRWVGIEDSSFL